MCCRLNCSDPCSDENFGLVPSNTSAVHDNRQSRAIVAPGRHGAVFTPVIWWLAPLPFTTPREFVLLVRIISFRATSIPFGRLLTNMLPSMAQSRASMACRLFRKDAGGQNRCGKKDCVFPLLIHLSPPAETGEHDSTLKAADCSMD